MRTIYIDSEFKCHTSNDGTMTAVETDFFDGKCDAFTRGHCFVPSKGGNVIYPYESYNELAAAQTQYERDMAELAAAYQEGVNSV